MQNQSSFKIIFKLKEFPIPSHFLLLRNVNPNIYRSLHESKQYRVKSDVREKNLILFINCWIHCQLPSISENNVNDLIILSNEFDIMKGYIQSYLKNRKIIEKQRLLKELKDHDTKYQKIVSFLFKNNGINDDVDYLEVKNKLFKACKNENVELVDIITRKKVTENQFTYVLSESEKTASLFSSKKFNIYNDDEITIPPNIVYNGEKYAITRILENSLFKSIDEFYYKIIFPENSEIKIIERNSLPRRVNDFTIQASVEELCPGWNYILNNVRIDISPLNKRYKYFDDKIIIGKSDKESDNYDLLLFCKRDVEEVTIPSFIRIIGSYAFFLCNPLVTNITINIPEDSELEIIDEFAFCNTNIKRIYIPKNVGLLKNGWCSSTPNLFEILISNENKNYIYYDNKMILGKHDEENEIFDTIIFCRRDIKEIIIPSFIKYIGSYSFENCSQLELITFENESKVKYISEYAFSSTSIKSISIPSSVIKICQFAFYDCKELKNVYISDDSNLEIIEHLAFGYTPIENIYIPAKVTQIHSGLFEKMKNLKSISISPNNKCFRYIDEKFIIGKSDINNDAYDTLIFCRKDISEVTIPSYIKYLGPYSFYHSNELKKIIFPFNSELEKICTFAFASSSIENISIPSKVSNIGKYAFYQCKQLRKVEISSNVSKISKHSFENCVLLSQVEFSNKSNLRYIEKNAFCCSRFQNITIPSSVIYFGPFSFKQSGFQVTFQPKSKLRLIDKYAFAESSIQTITIPQKVAKIGQGVFQNCLCLENVFFDENSELKIIDNESFKLADEINSILIPSSVELIGSSAFSLCRNIKSVYFADDSKLKYIEKYAFKKSSLKNISIPSSVIHIGQSAFEESLEKIHIPKNSKLEFIGESSFCLSKIESIYIPSHLKTIPSSCFLISNIKLIDISENSELEIIDEFAFCNTNIKRIYIPKNVGLLKDGWCSSTPNLFEILISNENKNYIYYDNKMILGKHDEENEIFDTIIFCRRDIKEIIIPSFIKNIGSYSFENCSQLELITFENESKVEYISEYAFSSTSIEFISIPSSIKQICESCFSYCENLQIVEFQSNSQLKTIGENAFQSCPLKQISIPSSVSYIGERAFCQCEQLENVTISENSDLKAIDKYAFYETAIKSIVIPSNLTCLKKNWFSNYINEIKVSPKCSMFSYVDYKLLVKKKDKTSEFFDSLVFCRRNTNEIIIPSFIKYIKSYAFNGFCRLEYVSFQSNSQLQKISHYAFANTSIISFFIPSSVSYISFNSFTNCLKLQIIEIGENSTLLENTSIMLNGSITKIVMIPAKLKDKYGNIFYNYD